MFIFTIYTIIVTGIRYIGHYKKGGKEPPYHKKKVGEHMLKEMFEQLVQSTNWDKHNFANRYVYTNEQLMIMVEVNSPYAYSFEHMEQLVHNDILTVMSLVITDRTKLDRCR